MELKKTNLVLLGITIVLFIVAILVLIKVLFLNAKGFEWGSVTDWVSALCNIAMAGAAVYAALNAKSWLSPKIQNEGFHQANQLILDMTQVNIVQQKMVAALNIMLIKNSNGRYEKYSHERANDIEKYHFLFKELSDLLISFGSRYLSLEIWKINSLKDDQFVQLISDLGNIHKMHQSILFSLRNNKHSVELNKTLRSKCDEVSKQRSLISSQIKKLSIPFDSLFK
jgi:hypothetical protein